MSTRYPGFDGLEFTAGELAQAAKPVGHDPTIKSYQAIFAQLRHNGHALPIGIIVDIDTAERMWSEFSSMGWSPNHMPFDAVHQLALDGVVFRW